MGASDVYSLEWQAAGLVFVAAASALGVGVSLCLASKAQTSPVLHGLKGLGCGVIISTALIHLINESYSDFEEAGWLQVYGAFPMIFAMLGILLLSLLDFCSMHAAKASQLERDLEENNEGCCDDDTGGRKKQRSVACLVEFSVLSHSVLIGLDLGMQTMSGWRALVIAICFHQFFEGIALGQVVSEAGHRTCAKALIAVAYSLTTALGILLGMAVYTLASSANPSLAPAVAILNSLCGGMLVYLGLVNLLYPWFVNNEQLLQGSRMLPVVTYVCLILGMTAMAVLAIWA